MHNQTTIEPIISLQHFGYKIWIIVFNYSAENLYLDYVQIRIRFEDFQKTPPNSPFFDTKRKRFCFILNRYKAGIRQPISSNRQDSQKRQHQVARFPCQCIGLGKHIIVIPSCQNTLLPPPHYIRVSAKPNSIIKTSSRS